MIVFNLPFSGVRGQILCSAEQFRAFAVVIFSVFSQLSISSKISKNPSKFVAKWQIFIFRVYSMYLN